ncbi:MAG: hypothetical protein ATN36_02700 [Epulopiscium sp. Nele67-Bin005]|nr:MAG: hypothetical protein ATN36_02700 [Epulopiscium sp. Nele67-Bin005]
MRQMVAIMLMVLICGGYYMYLDSVGKVADDGVLKEADLLLYLDETLERMETNYPKSVEEAISIYSEVLRHIYHLNTTEAVIEEAVPVLRTFYVDELLTLNPMQAQIDSLKAGHAITQEEENYMIGTNIKQVTYKDENTLANVIVDHALTRQIATKEYCFILANGEWKLYKWHDIVTETIEE